MRTSSSLSEGGSSRLIWRSPERFLAEGMRWSVGRLDMTGCSRVCGGKWYLREKASSVKHVDRLEVPPSDAPLKNATLKIQSPKLLRMALGCES